MEKKKYIIPEIEIIQFDKEISLGLQSVPEVGPEEGMIIAPSSMKTDPFNTSTV